MGPPWKAVTAAGSSLQFIDHYPAANCEPAISDLAEFLETKNCSRQEVHSRLMLGRVGWYIIERVGRIGGFW